MNKNNVFASHLLACRKAVGLSQKTLADAIGVSDAAITMMEKGKRLPSFEILRALTEYFQVPSDSLLGNGIYENWEQVLEFWDDIIHEVDRLNFPPYNVSHLVEAYSESVQGNKLKVGELLSSLLSNIEFKEDETGKTNIVLHWKF